MASRCSGSEAAAHGPFERKACASRLSFWRRKHGEECDVFLGHSNRTGEPNADDHSDAEGWGEHMDGHLPGCSHVRSAQRGSGDSGGDRGPAGQSDLASGASRRAGHWRSELPGFDPELPNWNASVSRAERMGRSAASDPSYGGPVELQFQQFGEQPEQLFVVEPQFQQFGKLAQLQLQQFGNEQFQQLVRVLQQQ